MSRRNQNLYGERCHKINEDTELIGTSSERESRKSRRRTICLCTLCSVILVLVAAAVVTLAVLILVRNDTTTPDQLPDDPYERALALLTDYPVIDGYVVSWDTSDWGRGLGGARASSTTIIVVIHY